MSNIATELADGDRAKLEDLFERYDREADELPSSDVTLAKIVEAIRADREGAH